MLLKPTDGRGDAITQDKYFALSPGPRRTQGYVAGIQSIGDQEFIAPAVKGNTQRY